MELFVWVLLVEVDLGKVVAQICTQEHIKHAVTTSWFVMV